ncbi:MAG: MerR family transcriptional regulator [Rhizobium sp.]|nr:MerR family transcriptional regulator [Rhizobium sp.]
MHRSQFLNASEAAARLGVSAKALRLYEQRGLLAPKRTEAGWRVYGPDEMVRATEIIALRGLGLSLAQISRVLKGDSGCLESVLAAHQEKLESQIRHVADAVDRVRSVRMDIAAGHRPPIGELARLVRLEAEIVVAFDLPWPWGGERFELSDIGPLNYIIGPLGSGKTRLAHAIADALPGAIYIGLDRLDDDGRHAQCQLDADPELKAQVARITEWLVDDGATAVSALTSLLVAIEAGEAAALVIDMVEQGLDHATQEALSAYLKRRDSPAGPLFLMTRSSAILDLGSITADEAIILCPANHSPPVRVAPYPEAPGYEAVATCLATPEVRARTEGVIAWRPAVA